MEARKTSPHIEDWAILKYGWLLVFLVHVVFLGFGVVEIKQALDMFDKKLLEIAELRIDHVIQGLYMLVIAFSVLLLIVAIFALEIFRTQRRILRELAALRSVGIASPADLGSTPPV